MMARVGVLYHYFAAPSDEVTADVIDLPDGARGRDAVSGNGIDPVVQSVAWLAEVAAGASMPSPMIAAIGTASVAAAGAPDSEGQGAHRRCHSLYGVLVCEGGGMGSANGRG